MLSSFKEVIIDICHKMENGMADFAHQAATTGKIYIATVAEYDLYCHYVAGLVGEGLSRIFTASGKEAEWLGQQLELSNSMGLLLQKTNIIRDYREDTDDQRYFWPKEIWGKYGFNEMKEMYAPGASEKAQWVQSGMILDALRHATDALEYLRFLKNQTIFNFCAIPASMAIATLELCFMNPDMFERNIKIRKATAAQVGRFDFTPSFYSNCIPHSSLLCGLQILAMLVRSSANTLVKFMQKPSRPIPTSCRFQSPVAR